MNAKDILQKLRGSDLSVLYAQAYKVMRSKHNTRSPLISMLREAGIDSDQTSIKTRRKLRRYLFDHGVELRGPDKQGFDPHTTALKSEAQRKIRAQETPKAARERMATMMKNRWIEKDPAALAAGIEKQRKALSKTLRNKSPEELLAIHRKAIHSFHHVTRDVNGKEVRFNSSWELSLFNVLERLGVDFRYNDRVLNMGNFLWYPDFYLPDHKTYLEVKGYYKAVQRWNEVIQPALPRCKKLRKRSIYLVEFKCKEEGFPSLEALLAKCRLVHGPGLLQTNKNGNTEPSPRRKTREGVTTESTNLRPSKRAR